MLRNICVDQGAMFSWDLSKPVLFYSDASSFATGCYISQGPEREKRPLHYHSFVFSKNERK